VWGSARSFEYSIEPEDNDNPEEKQSGDDDSRMTAQKKSRAEMITTQRKSRTELKIITTQTTRLSQRRRNSFSASHKQFLRLSQAEKQAHLAHIYEYWGTKNLREIYNKRKTANRGKWDQTERSRQWVLYCQANGLEEKNLRAP